MPEGNFTDRSTYVTGLPETSVSSTARVDPGPYIGIVKGYGDNSGMNRVAVYIPAISQQRISGADHSKKTELESNTIICSLALPYYGRTNFGSQGSEYQKTTKAYGMWLPTPDIDTQVLVVFAEGKMDNGYIISYVPDALMLHMVPGIASSPAFIPNDKTNSTSTTSPKFEVPVAEYNKLTASAIGPDTPWKNIPKPVHPLYSTLLDQGLELDYFRGLTTSSAQRETPSNVFGISTPGPLDREGPSHYQGLVKEPTDPGYKWSSSRKSGHTFVMDDGDNKGNNQLIRLRTGTGHQVLLSDDGGAIYVGTASGNAWAELRNDGSVDVFSAKDVSVHAEGNVNMLADVDVNIQAGEDINLLAGHNFKIETNKENVEGKGHAHIYINGNMKQYAAGTFNLSSEGWFNITATEAVSITSSACIYAKSGGGAKYPIKLNTEAGNIAEKPSQMVTRESNWVNKEASNTYGGKRWAVDGSYSYRTVMERVPMHEPDPRINNSKRKDPKPWDGSEGTVHIVDSST